MLKLGTRVTVTGGALAGVEGLVVSRAEVDRLSDRIRGDSGAVLAADVCPAGPPGGPAGWVSPDVRAGRAYCLALLMFGRAVPAVLPAEWVRPTGQA